MSSPTKSRQSSENPTRIYFLYHLDRVFNFLDVLCGFVVHTGYRALVGSQEAVRDSQTEKIIWLLASCHPSSLSTELRHVHLQVHEHVAVSHSVMETFSSVSADKQYWKFRWHCFKLPQVWLLSCILLERCGGSHLQVRSPVVNCEDVQKSNNFFTEATTQDVISCRCHFHKAINWRALDNAKWADVQYFTWKWERLHWAFWHTKYMQMYGSLCANSTKFPSNTTQKIITETYMHSHL